MYRWKGPRIAAMGAAFRAIPKWAVFDNPAKASGQATMCSLLTLKCKDLPSSLFP
jgi:hypothetical protein